MAHSRAIPVVYKGLTFRSTLEAQWAEYFDSLGLQWFYEPEALEAKNGVAWLPDFYLPELKLFVECKAWLGERLPKVGKFVIEAKQDVLLCFPSGRFVRCSHFDWSAAEDGEFKEGQIPYFLIKEDWKNIESAMKNRSCLSTDEDGLDARFVNFGEFCDAYCGSEPEYFDSIKDRCGPGGRDIRSYYWGGYSTWEQRGFFPSRYERA